LNVFLIVDLTLGLLNRNFFNHYLCSASFFNLEELKKFLFVHFIGKFIDISVSHDDLQIPSASDVAEAIDVLLTFYAQLIENLSNVLNCFRSKKALLLH